MVFNRLNRRFLNIATQLFHNYLDSFAIDFEKKVTVNLINVRFDVNEVFNFTTLGCTSEF